MPSLITTTADDTQKQIEQLKATITELNKALNQLVKNQQNLGNQSNDAGKELKNLIDTTKGAANSLKQFTEGINSNLKSITSSQQALNKAGSSMAKGTNAIDDATKKIKESTDVLAGKPSDQNQDMQKDPQPLLEAVIPKLDLSQIIIPALSLPKTLPMVKPDPNAMPVDPDNITVAHNNHKWREEFALKQKQLNQQKQQAINAAKDKGSSVLQVEESFKNQQKTLDQARLDAQIASEQKYVDATNALSDAVTKIFGKNTAAAKAAFKTHQATASAQVAIDTQKSIMNIWATDTSIPIVGIPLAIAHTAIAIATGASAVSTIWKQKPAMAKGGYFTSDGRGALLSGYSHTDDTNAYLRSGEAVVVSEAMRNPWARNLVSAINVAHGGRDFSIPNSSAGYAIGGIFTDGGNANRYYSQPVNDQKDLANTLAYQMLNNFPPIYVDVKDVNNQQNILAQTVNRVNL